MKIEQEQEQTKEEKLRDEQIPRFDNIKDLAAYIERLASDKHSYGSCVYAMSHAAVATFNYMASKLGVSGFQASCADMDILRHTRALQRGRVIDYKNLLYPQYIKSDYFPTVEDLMIENKEWLKEEARKRLEEKSPYAADGVLAHWKRLSEM